ncbi:endonuclease III domain-containing protein [Candidatus Woesearchaeota archaeon]|nr:endonuclease III domain-containing protein [Candidatus Woesearchaeota archaeon]
MHPNTKTTRSIRALYALLYDAYGPQGWWPIHGRYEKNRRSSLSGHERFEVMLGAILTQNTAWKNVELALENLRRKKLIDPKKISKTPHQKLAQLIRPAGYYNQKAERIKSFSGFVLQNPISSLQHKNLDALRSQLLSLHGIGPETADSMILYALDRPRFVIDAYTKRIFFRTGLCDNGIPYAELQSIIEHSVSENVCLYKEYHALLVELAKQHCKTTPVCTACPVLTRCAEGCQNRSAVPHRSATEHWPKLTRNKKVCFK